MKIAILGGSFDPPHIWHFWTAQQILENISEINQVWYMPDYQNAFRKIEAGVKDRLEMLKLMETGRILTSAIGISREEITYTVTIVKELVKDSSNHFLWIVGSDILAEFSRWREYQKLIKQIDFLVFPRKDYPIKKLPAGFSIVPGNIMFSNISSTIIRERVRQGKTIAGLVFPKVENYIKKHNLYK